MGDNAGRPGIGLPLSRNDRQKIENRLSALDERVRGSNVFRLVDLVEKSLSIKTDDLFSGEGLKDITNGTEVDTHAEGEIDMLKVEVALRGLLASAAMLGSLLPPTDAISPTEYLAKYPSHPGYDHLTAALSRICGETIAPTNELGLATIHQAISNLISLEFQNGATAPSFYDGSSARWLVRAVMFYRHEQNLPLTIYWARTEKSGSEKGKHRDDRDIAPISDSAQLVGAVAGAFEMNQAVRSLGSGPIDVSVAI